jgi:uncharacterized repeat protein (TIGR01451 family)
MTYTRRGRGRRLGVATLGCSMVLTGGTLALLAPAASAATTTPTVTITKVAGFPNGSDANSGDFEDRAGTEPIVGQTVIYRLTLTRTNVANGNVETTHDVLPSGVTFVADSFAGTGSGESATYDSGTNTVTWTSKKNANNDNSDSLTYMVVVDQTGALTNTATVVAPADSDSVTLNPVAIKKNPDLELKSCPQSYKVTLVLDSSGSIQNPGVAVDTVRNAADSFLQALKGTGSKVNIVQFSDLGQTLLSPMTSINDTTLGAGGAIHEALFGANGYYGSASGNQHGGYTNWASGLDQAQQLAATEQPDLVLFVTDGVPNKYNLSGSQGADDTEARRSIARNKAVDISNAMKADGIKFIGIGLGQIANSPANSDDLWTRNLLAVTGDTFTTTGAPNDVNTDDVRTVDAIIDQDFSSLGASLAKIANALCGQPDIGVTKTVEPGTITAGNPGGSATFTITVTNPATLPLEVSLSDILTDTNGSTSAVVPTYVSGDDSPTNGLLDKGEAWVYTYDYTNTTNASGTVVNSVKVTGSNEGHDDVSASATATLNVEKKIEPRYALELEKTVGDEQESISVDPGESADYELTVTNTGNSTFSEVDLSDVFDPAVEGFSCEETTFGPLGVDASHTFNCTWAVPEDQLAGNYPNTATVIGKVGETEKASDTDTANVTVNPNPGLSVDKEVSRSFDLSRPASGDFVRDVTYTVGSSAIYQYTVTNTGNVPLHDIRLTDGSLDMKYSNSSVSADLGVANEPTFNDLALCRVDNDHGSVPVSQRSATINAYDLGDGIGSGLDPGESVTIYCILPIRSNFTPVAGARVFNQASITGTFGGDNEEDQGQDVDATSQLTSIAINPVVVPSCTELGNCPPPPCTTCNPPPPPTPVYDLGITKTANVGTVTPGAAVSYTLTVTAAANSASLTNVVVTDAVPAELENVTVTGPAGWTCGVVAQTVTCTKPTFAVDEKAVFTVKATVKANVTNGAVIKNVGTVKATETEVTLTNNTATASVAASVPPQVIPQTLPPTGGNLRLVGVAMIMLGLGALALLFGRRRRLTI